MTERDKTEFSACLKAAADLYGRPALSTEALKIFFILLAKYSLAQVKKALQEHMRASPFMPKPCDVIKRIEGTEEERAIAAWGLVSKAVERWGYYESVKFPSPAIHYAIAQMDGWMRFCRSLTEDNMPFRARDFKAAFVLGERCASWTGENGTVRVLPHLPGWCELNNRSQGLALPPQVRDASTGAIVETIALPGSQSTIVPFMAELTQKMAAGGAR